MGEETSGATNRAGLEVKLDQKWDEIRAEVTASLKNSKK